MIKCDRGNVEINGILPMIQAELEQLLIAIRKTIAEKMGDDIAKELVTDVFNNSMKSDEESKKDFEELISRTSDEKIGAALRELMEELAGAKNE